MSDGWSQALLLAQQDMLWDKSAGRGPVGNSSKSSSELAKEPGSESPEVEGSHILTSNCVRAKTWSSKSAHEPA